MRLSKHTLLSLVLILWVSACQPARPTPIPPTPTTLHPADAPWQPTSTAGPRDCSGPDAFPTEEAELIYPSLRQVRPDQAAPGEKVEILGVGGHLYWDNECGEFWLESARDFQLLFDGEAAGAINCYASNCVAELTVPADALPAIHSISVEGGSSLDLEMLSQISFGVQ